MHFIIIAIGCFVMSGEHFHFIKSSFIVLIMLNVIHLDNSAINMKLTINLIFSFITINFKFFQAIIHSQDLLKVDLTLVNTAHLFITTHLNLFVQDHS